MKSNSKTTGRWICVGMLWSCIAFSAQAAELEPVLESHSGKYLNPFSCFVDNLTDSFSGLNLAFHLGAIGSTVLLVATEVDDEVQNFFRNHEPFGQVVADTTHLFGLGWHVLTGTSLWLIGRQIGDPEISGAGSAALQAVGTTFLVTGLEKLLTGRSGPRHADPDGLWTHTESPRKDDPKDFNFDFWNHWNIHESYWPSGHTSTAFAFVSAMTAYYPEHGWIPLLGYPIALFIGINMIDGDYHWFSDVIAGALLGHVIGWTTGKNFRQKYERRFGNPASTVENQDLHISLQPMVVSQGRGLALVLHY